MVYPKIFLFKDLLHATSPRIIPPCMQFLFVGSRICRQLPSDSTSQWTPLLLANTPNCKACSGLAPYSVITMSGAHKKRRLCSQRFLLSFEPKPSNSGSGYTMGFAGSHLMG